MRFQDWDCLIFPLENSTPISEFKTKFQFHPDPDETLRSIVAIKDVPTIATVECFIPSIGNGAPIQISIHSWQPPKVANAETLSSHHCPMFEIRVIIDGIPETYVLSAPDEKWPITLASIPSPRSSDGRRIVFPTFDMRNLLNTNRTDKGKITIMVSEGYYGPGLATYARCRNIVAFKFNYAPLEVLQQYGLAYPPNHWLQAQPAAGWPMMPMESMAPIKNPYITGQQLPPANNTILPPSVRSAMQSNATEPASPRDHRNFNSSSSQTPSLSGTDLSTNMSTGRPLRPQSIESFTGHLGPYQGVDMLQYSSSHLSNEQWNILRGPLPKFGDMPPPSLQQNGSQDPYYGVQYPRSNQQLVPPQLPNLRKLSARDTSIADYSTSSTSTNEVTSSESGQQNSNMVDPIQRMPTAKATSPVKLMSPMNDVFIRGTSAIPMMSPPKLVAVDEDVAQQSVTRIVKASRPTTPENLDSKVTGLLEAFTRLTPQAHIRLEISAGPSREPSPTKSSSHRETSESRSRHGSRLTSREPSPSRRGNSFRHENPRRVVSEMTDITEKNTSDEFEDSTSEGFSKADSIVVRKEISSPRKKGKNAQVSESKERQYASTAKEEIKLFKTPRHAEPRSKKRNTVKQAGEENLEPQLITHAAKNNNEKVMDNKRTTKVERKSYASALLDLNESV